MSCMRDMYEYACVNVDMHVGMYVCMYVSEKLYEYIRSIKTVTILLAILPAKFHTLEFAPSCERY